MGTVTKNKDLSRRQKEEEKRLQIGSDLNQLVLCSRDLRGMTITLGEREKPIKGRKIRAGRGERKKGE